MEQSKILVIGEKCTDFFSYGFLKGQSPEGKGQVFTVTKTTHNPGMAANTAANLIALGAKVDTFFDKDNITKTRYVDESTNELYLRTDLRDSVNPANIYNLPKLSNYDAIIISDYSKGFLTIRDIETISQMHRFVVLDTKKKLGDWCKNLKFIKVNRIECELNKEFVENCEWAQDKLLITLDKDGVRYRDKSFLVEPIDNPDVSGAGDTFIAAFTVKYLETQSVDESIEYANKMSSIVVAKKGVATP